MNYNKEDFYFLGDNITLNGQLGICNPNRISIGNNVVTSEFDHLVVVNVLHNRKRDFNLNIKDGVFINDNVKIEVVNYVEIGKLVAIGPNVYISDMKHLYKDFKIPVNKQEFDYSYPNSVIIKDGALIGANSTVVGNVIIGYGSVIGANSAVVANIPDHVVAVGTPARVIKICDYRTGEWIETKGNDTLLNEILKIRGTFNGYDFTEKESSNTEIYALNMEETRVYKNNIQYLSEYQNIDINNVELSWDNYKIVTNEVSNKSIMISKNGMWNYIGKKDGTDLNEFINEIEPEYIEDAIVIFGFGIGEHIRRVLKKFPKNKVLVLESDFQLLKIAAVCEDLSDILSNERLAIGLFKNGNDLNSILSNYFGTQNKVNFIVASFSNYNEIYNEEFSCFIDTLSNFEEEIQKNIISACELSEKLLNSNESLNIIKSTLNEWGKTNKNSLRELENEFKKYQKLLIEGEKILSRIYDYMLGNKNINIEKDVARYNEIENIISSENIVNEILKCSMYKYMDSIYDDINLKIRISDNGSEMQLKDLKKNIIVYNSRTECVKRLLENFK